MASSPATSATGAVPGESPAQAKARLRRERLAAKSGASRLQQITALQGGPPRELSELEKDVPGMRPFQCSTNLPASRVLHSLRRLCVGARSESSRLTASQPNQHPPRHAPHPPCPAQLRLIRMRLTSPNITSRLRRNLVCLLPLLLMALVHRPFLQA